MSEAVLTSLILIFALQAKHLIADFFLQGPFIIENRRTYGHPGGLLHVAIHAAGTAVVLIVFGFVSPAFFALILIGEAFVHYHIDWAKDNYVQSRQLTPRDAPYWYATGIDQALHQATYLVIAGAWASRSFVVV